ncbi:MAG: outer membrane beta-barrel protein [Acidobacteriia bacterium]|nr:outer membrane beta-barrel protein [Terriglobia bacterium]
MNRFLGKTCALGLALVAGLLVLAPVGFAQDTNWKGFYAGGNVGGAFGSSDAQTSTIYSATGYFATTSVPAIATTGAQHLTPRGVSGGGQAGYNFQSGHFVLGAEADFGAMNLSNSVSGTAVYPCCAPTAFTVTQSVNTSWLFTARPRVGYASGRALVYGTAGLAMTNLNYQATFTDTYATAAESGGVNKTQTGWAAGGGVEYRVGSHWSLTGEYLYANFGSVSATSTNLTAYTPAQSYPTNIFTHSANLHSHIARFGVNYRF